MGKCEKSGANLKFTLAIPFHSGIEYLERALNSVAAQTRTDWHCLVADDSKTGEGEETVSRMGDRFTYLRNESPGNMVDNWNFCIRESKTEWITLLHADDLLKPDYLSCIAEAMESSPGAVAYFCGAEVIDATDKVKFSFPDYVKTWIRPRKEKIVLSGEKGLFQLLKGAFIFCPTLCYHRPSLRLSPFDRSYDMVQDLELQLRLLTAGCEIAGTSRIGYSYRRHEDNASASLTENFERFDEEFALYETYREIMENRGFAKAAQVAKKKRILFLHLAYRWVLSLVALKPRQSQKILKYALRNFGVNSHGMVTEN